VTAIQNTEQSAPAIRVTRPKRLGLALGMGRGAAAGGCCDVFAGFSSGTVCPKVFTMGALSPEFPTFLNLIMFKAGFTRISHKKPGLTGP
jgi:hypothetical protein